MPNSRGDLVLAGKADGYASSSSPPAVPTTQALVQRLVVVAAGGVGDTGPRAPLPAEPAAGARLGRWCSGSAR